MENYPFLLQEITKLFEVVKEMQENAPKTDGEKCSQKFLESMQTVSETAQFISDMSKQTVYQIMK